MQLPDLGHHNEHGGSRFTLDMSMTVAEDVGTG